MKPIADFVGALVETVLEIEPDAYVVIGLQPGQLYYTCEIGAGSCCSSEDTNFTKEEGVKCGSWIAKEARKLSEIQGTS